MWLDKKRSVQTMEIFLLISINLLKYLLYCAENLHAVILWQWMRFYWLSFLWFCFYEGKGFWHFIYIKEIEGLFPSILCGFIFAWRYIRHFPKTYSFQFGTNFPNINLRKTLLHKTGHCCLKGKKWKLNGKT